MAEFLKWDLTSLYCRTRTNQEQMHTTANNPQSEYYIWFNSESEAVESGTYEEFELMSILSGKPDSLKLICKTESNQIASKAFEEIAKDLNEQIRLFSA